MRVPTFVIVALSVVALALMAGCIGDSGTQPEPTIFAPDLSVGLDKPIVRGPNDPGVTVDIDEPSGAEDDDDEVTVDIDEPS